MNDYPPRSPPPRGRSNFPRGDSGPPRDVYSGRGYSENPRSRGGMPNRAGYDENDVYARPPPSHMEISGRGAAAGGFSGNQRPTRGGGYGNDDREFNQMPSSRDNDNYPSRGAFTNQSARGNSSGRGRFSDENDVYARPPPSQIGYSNRGAAANGFSGNERSTRGGYGNESREFNQMPSSRGNDHTSTRGGNAYGRDEAVSIQSTRGNSSGHGRYNDEDDFVRPPPSHIGYSNRGAADNQRPTRGGGYANEGREFNQMPSSRGHDHSSTRGGNAYGRDEAVSIQSTRGNSSGRGRYNDENDDFVRPPPSQIGSSNRGAADNQRPTRGGGYANEGREFSQMPSSRGNDHTSTRGDNAYGRDEAVSNQSTRGNSSSRGRYNDENDDFVRPPPSQIGYSNRGAAANGFSGNERSTRGGYGNEGREFNQMASSRNNDNYPPRGGYTSGRGDYYNHQATRGNSSSRGRYSDENDDSARPPPSQIGYSNRGAAASGFSGNERSTRGEGYGNEGREFNQMASSRNNDNYPPRGGYTSGRGDSYNHQATRGNSSSRGRYSDENDEVARPPSSYMGYSSRGAAAVGFADNQRPSRGGGFVGRFDGESQGNRGGASRYNDRRDDNGINGATTGYSGYNSYEDKRKEFNEENHAPRDFRPVDRDIQEIVKEDKEDAEQNTATIFDGDSDIKVDFDDDADVKENIQYDSWNEMNLHENLLNNILASKYVKPRKIQQKTMPYIMENYDVKCQGETGSGKTAAFLIPIIQKLIEQNQTGQLPRGNPICLVVCPTRELATQIYEQTRKLAEKTGITCARAYGEYNVRQNIMDLKAGCNILVCCVGRLMHFVRNGDVNLRDLKYLILDEADRLLMEHSNSDILQLFQWPELPRGDDIQTLLFSATLRDPQVLELTKNYMRKKCVSVTATCSSNKRVQYKVYPVERAAAKFRYLLTYMKRITEENGGKVPSTLIFVNRKINTDRVAVELTSNQFFSTTIHGDRGQHLREEALASFRSGKTKCLVATDVCARGVDVKKMDYIINFDLPMERDVFIQRCGRTGRTHIGYAVSFYVEDDDRGFGSVIASIIQESGQEAPQFLNGVVQTSDLNFGQGLTEEDADGGSRSNSAPPPAYGSSRQATPQPTEINDPSADDGWD